MNLVIWAAGQQNKHQVEMNQKKQTEHYTFTLSDRVTRQKVTFKNRYGITLNGDLYIPKKHTNKPLPTLAVCGPFGAVKEQASGLLPIKWQNEVLLLWLLILLIQEKAAGNLAM